MLAWASRTARSRTAMLTVPLISAVRLASMAGAASKAVTPPGLGRRVGWEVSISTGPRRISSGWPARTRIQ